MLDELAQKHTAKFIFKPERKWGVDRAEDFGGKGGNGRRKKRKAKGRLMKRGKEGVPVFDNVKVCDVTNFRDWFKIEYYDYMLRIKAMLDLKYFNSYVPI